MPNGIKYSIDKEKEDILAEYLRSEAIDTVLVMETWLKTMTEM